MGVAPTERATGRRDDVARAAYSVISRDGFDRASLRAIAAEMNCSTGVLTHYFRDKRALTKFVLDRLLEDLIAAGDTPAARATTLEKTILAILPHNEESRIWWRVFLHFSTASINDPSLRDDEARRETIVVERLRDSLLREVAAGRLPEQIDADLEAHALLPFIDGLGFHSVLAPHRYTRALQRRLVSAAVEKLSRCNVIAA